MPIILGTAVVAGAGYYLYSAGGSPKVAETKLESTSLSFSFFFFFFFSVMR